MDTACRTSETDGNTATGRGDTGDLATTGAVRN
jgi:hypothetical protein